MPETYTPDEQRLIALWQRHMDSEFADKDAAAAVSTMTPEAFCNHNPVLTGGTGAEQMLAFYRDHFIPKLPADLQMELISRTVGQNRVIDEEVLRFTHDIEMDWLLPGVAPTRRRVEAVFVVIVQFDTQGRIAHEHIYWDQATVLAQIGLIDADRLPVAGAEAARKARDQAYCPSNALIHRGEQRAAPR
jgi:carboxymethylenebutenolidase